MNQITCVLYSRLLEDICHRQTTAYTPKTTCRLFTIGIVKAPTKDSVKGMLQCSYIPSPNASEAFLSHSSAPAKQSLCLFAKVVGGNIFTEHVG